MEDQKIILYDESGRLTCEGRDYRRSAIRSGKSVLEIAKHLKISRAALYEHFKIHPEDRQLYDDTRSHIAEHEELTRAEEEERKSFILGIVNQVVGYKYQNASRRERFAHKKALLSQNSIIFPYEIPYGVRFDIFESYFRSMQNGRDLSLESMGRPHGLYPASVSRLLKRAGLKPFKEVKRGALTSEERQRLERTFKIDSMNCCDLSYFSKLPPYVIRRKRIKETGSAGGLEYSNRFLLDLGVLGKMNYRIASEAYEASDIGFSLNEVYEYMGGNLDSKPIFFLHAIENRKNIEQVIMKTLKTIWIDQEITGPYINWNNSV